MPYSNLISLHDLLSKHKPAQTLPSLRSFGWFPWLSGYKSWSSWGLRVNGYFLGFPSLSCSWMSTDVLGWLPCWSLTSQRSSPSLCRHLSFSLLSFLRLETLGPCMYQASHPGSCLTPVQLRPGTCYRKKPASHSRRTICLCLECQIRRVHHPPRLAFTVLDGV